MFTATSCMTNAFQFAIEGHIAVSEGSQALVCNDDSRLRVIPQMKDYPSGQMMWHLIPSTNSNGSISQVKVINVEPLRVRDGNAQDQCLVVGRVVQLSKRQGQVLLKVDLAEAKPLRLTLLHPDSQMQVGQLWSCTAVNKPESFTKL